MGYENVKNSYLRNQVMGASPNKLIDMLYQGAIKSVKIAGIAIENNDAKKAHKELIRAQDILMELKGSLNTEIEGNVPENLESLYEFMYQQLVKANMNKDQTLLPPVVKMLTELLDAWEQITTEVK
ncbi:flagellar export chaperone FliS [Liquorilactobacillus uvarum]|uniref:flagellar export chaperone FliS n=1 Tax=Liquorilactobacillus uvarum TaxID=303240 RepID=UPI00288AA5F3|nr:flagellar export chaperone FliS [Liquorilactobacillus uvarum]